MAAAPKPKTDAGNPDADASPKKKKKLLLMIGVAIALIAISVGGTLVALKFLAPPTPPASEESVEEEHAEITLAPAIYYEMKPNFTINFNVNGRQRYLQAAMTLLYRDPLLEELLKLHMPAIRNGLVMLLSSKSFDELQTTEGKEALREAALDIIRSQLEKEQKLLSVDGDGKEVPTSNVEQVLFTNFVMQ